MLAIATLVGTLTSSARAQAPVLPGAVRASLDADYPGWKTIAPPTADSATVATGDFDGDGARDYAAFLIMPVPKGEEIGTPMGRVMAFLRHAGGYRIVPVSRPIDASKEARIHLRTLRKGTEQRDLTLRRAFILEHDGLLVSPWHGGPCHTFVYRRGAFADVWTCD